MKEKVIESKNVMKEKVKESKNLRDLLQHRSLKAVVP